MADGNAPVIVTGAAGFIGSHLVESLLAREARVVGLDNFDPFYGRARKEENLRACRASARPGRFEFAECDIRDADAVFSLFERTRPAGVIHIAAKAGVRPSIADPVGYARTNVEGTAVVLEAARRTGCSRVVVASSSSVYGNNRKTPFSEADAVDGPISPYAATKRACELIGHAHRSLTGMPVAMLRFFTVFGPRQRPDLAIAKFMASIAAEREIEVFGDGSMMRDYTYIDDVIAGVLAAYDRVPAHGYRIWNLGSDRPVRLDEMVATIARTVGRTARIKPLPPQPGDVERTWADLSRSRSELGYAPRTPFEEGVRRQWEWLKASAI